MPIGFEISVRPYVWRVTAETDENWQWKEFIKICYICSEFG
jgi:hypothetical protein